VKTPVSKSINNADHPSGDLPSIPISPSRLWLKLQLLLNLVFVNLGFFAFLPYFLSHSVHPSFPFFLFWLVINFICVYFFINKKHKEKTPSQISVKNSIWIIEYQNQRFYCELSTDIVCWQWIIIIPLYCSQRQKMLRIILLNDCLNAKDNAKIRRWIYSNHN
jgi:hypothetical protein